MLQIGKTESALNAAIEKRGALFAVLLDPDTSDDTALLKAGSMAAENGADHLRHVSRLSAGRNRSLHHCRYAPV